MIKSQHTTVTNFLSPQIMIELEELKSKIDKALKRNDAEKYSALLELLADLQNEAGLYDEAREEFHKLLKFYFDPLNIARINRKIAHSYTLQKTCVEAAAYIEKATILLKKDKNETARWHAEYIETLLVKSDLLYFNISSIEEKLENNECIKEVLNEWGTEEQKLQFYRHVLYIGYQRYRWYNFPDELLSHALYYSYLANKKNHAFFIADSLENLAFIYLFRNEFKQAIETFKKCIDLLQGKQSDLLMIAHNYIALAYRMIDNLSECEAWTNKAYQLAEKMQNENYTAQQLGNFAWLSFKRNNDQYTEDFALKGFLSMTKTNHPFLWITCMPLIAMYSKNKDWESAGRYAHCLLHPQVQRLPEKLNSSLKRVTKKWQMEDWMEIEDVFNNVLTEAQLTHFY